MKIIVQKFGGTSVRDTNGKKHALAHIRQSLDAGYKVVVVVSAMGRIGDPYATDTLLELVSGGQYISRREQDLLLSCGEIISSVVFSSMLNENGIKSTAITGGKAGFRTNDDFNNAKILHVDSEEMMKLLADYDVVVVAGFQGITSSGDVTTLGRGGSDTTAAALGVSLQATYIDIFTDVEGVMTADPRIVKDAKQLTEATYTEISNMAHQGAKVIHPRAVEIAMAGKIPMRIRSTYTTSEGTLVTAKGTDEVSERLVTAITHATNITQIKIRTAEDEKDVQSQIFQAMAHAGISVDFINISPTVVAYTVSDTVADKAVEVLKNTGLIPVVNKSCAKVATVGGGITGVPGITSKIVTALAEKDIPILQSADSHTTIWVLVHEQDMIQAVNALHQTFELGNENK